MGDLALIAFYYLLHVGENTIKLSCNNSKQTIRFCMCDVTFFKRDASGYLKQLPQSAPRDLLLQADNTTLKLESQKNGWHGVCINHEWNGDMVYDPVQALACRFIHTRQHMGGKWDKFLSAMFCDRVRSDVTDNNIHLALKYEAAHLDYPVTRGIPIERINTHSLQIGGANALALASYSDQQIQKMRNMYGNNCQSSSKVCPVSTLRVECSMTSRTPCWQWHTQHTFPCSLTLRWCNDSSHP